MYFEKIYPIMKWVYTAMLAKWSDNDWYRFEVQYYEWVYWFSWIKFDRDEYIKYIGKISGQKYNSWMDVVLERELAIIDEIIKND